MEQIISKDDIISGFPSAERLNTSLIDDDIIILAQLKFLSPILGRDLVTTLASESYQDYISDYIRPAMVLYVRYLLIDRVSVDVGVMGVQQYATDYSKVASDETVENFKRTLLSQAKTYIEEAIVQLDNESELQEIYLNDTSRSHACLVGGIIL